VLSKMRPGEPLPEPIGGTVTLEPDEADEAFLTLTRLQQDAKAFVVKRWFAISTVAATLLERRLISGDEINAIVRTHPAGRAN
jgi:hypothetical protein